MRYLEAENPYIICRFATGDTVTIDIYDLSDNSKLVDTASMSEVGSTGYFKYLFNPSPLALTEYMYITSNGTEEHAGKIILGGYPDDVTDTLQVISNDVGGLNGDAMRGTDGVDTSPMRGTDGVDTSPMRGTDGVDTSPMRGTDSVPTNPLLANDSRLDSLTEIDYLLKIVKNKKELKKTGSVWSLVIYDDDDVTPILSKEIKDKDSNDITDLEAGTLAQELASSV